MGDHIDHYMVEVEDAAGRAAFVSDEIIDVKEAKALARRSSALSKNEFRAYVIAYVAAEHVGGCPTYRPVGSIGYFDRRISERDGCLA